MSLRFSLRGFKNSLETIMDQFETIKGFRENVKIFKTGSHDRVTEGRPCGYSTRPCA